MKSFVNAALEAAGLWFIILSVIFGAEILR